MAELAAAGAEDRGGVQAIRPVASAGAIALMTHGRLPVHDEDLECAVVIHPASAVIRCPGMEQESPLQELGRALRSSATLRDIPLAERLEKLGQHSADGVVHLIPEDLMGPLGHALRFSGMDARQFAQQQFVWAGLRSMGIVEVWQVCFLRRREAGNRECRGPLVGHNTEV